MKEITFGTDITFKSFLWRCDEKKMCVQHSGMLTERVKNIAGTVQYCAEAVTNIAGTVQYCAEAVTKAVLLRYDTVCQVSGGRCCEA
jgi:hypothetical protein